MSTATQTSSVLIRRKLDATQPRAVVDLATVWRAIYRTDAQAHAASLAFHGHRAWNVAPPQPQPRYLAHPTPGLCIEFWVDDRDPRHRLPGKPKQGPKPRNVLSGRHVDRDREVA